MIRSRPTTGLAVAAVTAILAFAPSAAHAAPDLTVTETPTTAGSAPHSVAVVPSGPDAGTVWVTDDGLGTVSAYDPTTKELLTSVQFPAGTKPRDVIAGSDGSVWVAAFSSPSVFKITDALDDDRSLQELEISDDPYLHTLNLAFDADESHVWVSSSDDYADKTARFVGISTSAPLGAAAITDRVDTGSAGGGAVAAGPDGRMWVANQIYGKGISAYDPATKELTSYLTGPLQTPTSGGYLGLTSAGSNVFATNFAAAAPSVVKVDPTGDVVATTKLPTDSLPREAIVAPDPQTGAQTLYVVLQGQGAATAGVARIAPETMQLIDIIELPTADASPYSLGYVPSTRTFWGTEHAKQRLFQITANPTDAPTVTVTGLDPDHGPESGGTRVTITGTALDRVTGVAFDDVPASDFTASTDGTTLTVTAPEHAPGTVDVVLAGPDGGATLADGYTYDPEATAPPTSEPTPPTSSPVPPQSGTGDASGDSADGGLPGFVVNTGGTTVAGTAPPARWVRALAAFPVAAASRLDIRHVD